MAGTSHQAASFEMSATRFIVCATPRSSASRLARIAGSSAMTMHVVEEAVDGGLGGRERQQRAGEVAARAAVVDDRLELLEREIEVVLGAVGEARRGRRRPPPRLRPCAGC